MTYFIDLFSPETYAAFSRSSRDVSGFRLGHRWVAERINAGDIFVCYLSRLSRWFGLLKVLQGPFVDDTPVFLPKNDPYVVRFKVQPLTWLDLDKAIPMHADEIWNGLSFTRGRAPGSTAWTGKVCGSLVRLDDHDGKFLADRLLLQSRGSKTYPLTGNDQRKIAADTVTRRYWKADHDISS